MSAQKQSVRYEYEGYALFPELFSNSELGGIEGVLERFHAAWLGDNAQHYENGAVNSAYLTSPQYLNEEDRLRLFQFIGSHKMSSVLDAVLADEVMFVGSQLFFDPANAQQKNYWHRDIQYNDMTIDQQQALMLKSNPLHVRIAMKAERGIELVPGTHRRWDDEYEYNVRMKRDGKEPHFDLPNGLELAMQRGDVLVFSAAMIHRGLYGQNRRSLDLLFGDAEMEVARFIQSECLPDSKQLSQLEWTAPFELARELSSTLPSA